MKYLSFVKFSRLFNWSVRYLNDSEISFSKGFPMIRIGEFLKRNKTSVTIRDGETYKRATIKIRNGGISIRDNAQGENIGTKKQFLISSGQFLLSKIDARNGAFGVVPKELEGGIITGNFWTFDVDYSIVNPHYLTLLTTTNAFIDFCDRASNGTTNRHYLQEDLFLNIKIPVPPLSEQENIVREFNDIKSFIKKERMKVKDIDVAAIAGVREALGVEPYQGHIEHNLINYKNFSTVDSWSVARILCNDNSTFSKSKYRCSRLSEVAWINPRTDLSMLEESDYLSFIPMEDISDEYGEWNKVNVGRKNKTKGYTKFQDGDIIWARISPCMQNGKSALLRELVNGKGYGSTEFHVIRLKSTDEVLPEYIHLLLRHSDILSDAKSHFTGSAGQQRVPAAYLENLIIPIPPLDIQKQISDEYFRGIEIIKEKSAKIDEYITVVKRNIELKIFE